jgi:hypothetical protein
MPMFEKNREWSEAEHAAYEQLDPSDLGFAGPDPHEPGFGPVTKDAIPCTCVSDIERKYEHCPGCDGCVHAERDNLEACPLCGEEL